MDFKKAIYNPFSKLQLLLVLYISHGHVIAFWALGNQLAFMISCNTPLSCDHNLQFFPVSSKKCSFGWIDLLKHHMICLITIVTPFMIIIIKTVVKSSPVTWWFGLQLQWLMTEILGSIVFISWGLPVSFHGETTPFQFPRRPKFSYEKSNNLSINRFYNAVLSSFEAHIPHIKVLISCILICTPIDMPCSSVNVSWGFICNSIFPFLLKQILHTHFCDLNILCFFHNIWFL